MSNHWVSLKEPKPFWSSCLTFPQGHTGTYVKGRTSGVLVGSSFLAAGCGSQWKYLVFPGCLSVLSRPDLQPPALIGRPLKEGSWPFWFSEFASEILRFRNLLWLNVSGHENINASVVASAVNSYINKAQELQQAPPPSVLPLMTWKWYCCCSLCFINEGRETEDISQPASEKLGASYAQAYALPPPLGLPPH